MFYKQIPCSWATIKLFGVDHLSQEDCNAILGIIEKSKKQCFLIELDFGLKYSEENDLVQIKKKIVQSGKKYFEIDSSGKKEYGLFISDAGFIELFLLRFFQNNLRKSREKIRKYCKSFYKHMLLEREKNMTNEIVFHLKKLKKLKKRPEEICIVVGKIHAQAIYTQIKNSK